MPVAAQHMQIPLSKSWDSVIAIVTVNSNVDGPKAAAKQLHDWVRLVQVVLRMCVIITSYDVLVMQLTACQGTYA